MENINKKLFCKYNFDVLISHLNNKKIPDYPKNLPNEKFPLFVSWKNTQNNDLRGCIGTFSFELLSKQLKNYSIISATQDTRFKPIDINELKKLTNVVYLLHSFENNKSCFDWEIGVHGIQIFFEKNNKKYDSTFLPSVMIEHKMTKEEAINCLIDKSGYRGSKIPYNDIIITRYQGSQYELSYEEYMKMI